MIVRAHVGGIVPTLIWMNENPLLPHLLPPCPSFVTHLPVLLNGQGSNLGEGGGSQISGQGCLSIYLF